MILAYHLSPVLFPEEYFSIHLAKRSTSLKLGWKSFRSQINLPKSGWDSNRCKSQSQLEMLKRCPQNQSFCDERFNLMPTWVWLSCDYTLRVHPVNWTFNQLRTPPSHNTPHYYYAFSVIECCLVSKRHVESSRKKTHQLRMSDFSIRGGQYSKFPGWGGCLQLLLQQIPTLS